MLVQSVTLNILSTFLDVLVIANIVLVDYKHRQLLEYFMPFCHVMLCISLPSD